MDASTKIFLAGVVGALAPELVRQYGLATAGGKVTWSPVFYLTTSALMALLGGFVAVILPCENISSAFYAGIGTPALITAAARKAMKADSLDGAAGAGAPNKGIATPGIAGVAPPLRLSRVDAFIRAL